ncbi:MAG: aminoglycoside phosphotransferase family protein [Proteiniphilum sp.]|jgi:spectinomycin phosphotransferase|nr:aminoglycoside phosphotransferase family protein [Proteiniphilum sp.]
MFEKILKSNYNIETKSITQIEGGWSALAYIVEDFDNIKYLLKVYEKSRASTTYLTSKIDAYMPIIEWLNVNTKLKGKIIHPLSTLSGSFKCADKENIYLLSTYIEGSNLLALNLTTSQVKDLASIVVELHSHGKDIPISTQLIKEDFDIEFTNKITSHLEQIDTLNAPLKELIQPSALHILHGIKLLTELSTVLKNSNLKSCLCHTDIHEGNILQTESGIVLIDWEGLKLAPAEADFFDIVRKDWQSIFFKKYKEIHPSYESNLDCLKFYQLRRILEDIWEFIEQLQYDEQSEEEQKVSLAYLESECLTVKDYF